MSVTAHAGPVATPLAEPGRTIRTMRLQGRRRFALASTLLALGSALLAVAVAFLLILSAVGGLTGMILGVLLQVLGLVAAAFASIVLRRSFPISEVAGASRRILMTCVLAILPGAFLASVAWLVFVVRESPILAPAMPLFWGPVSIAGALGLLYAARELASIRLTIVAGVGCGAIIATTLSAAAASLVDPRTTLTSARLAVDLGLIGLGFGSMAFAFQFDARSARVLPRA